MTRAVLLAIPIVTIAQAADQMPGRSNRAFATTTLRVGLARQGGGYTMRTMALEQYVAGVVAGEAARGSGPPALEALAITVRTFAMANLGRHNADGFDMCDQVHCQVLRTPTSATAQAAAATAGQMLLYRSAPASIFYTASCGGRTERPSAVWPGAPDPEFLPSRDDDACEGAPAWSGDLSAADLARALRSGGFRGDRLRDLRIVSRNDSGRVAQLAIDGFSPSHISGQDLRTLVGRTLGWQFIKSTWFDLRPTDAGFRFSGRGSGHGVGLCVIGSAKLAARGQSALQILARYFPGLDLSWRPGPVTRATGAASGARAGSEVTGAPAADSRVVLSLPEGDEGERDVIRDLAARSRDTLARQLDVAEPSRITLRFHPTVEDYQHATGQPWFTAGATVGAEIHFVPLAVLRGRGVLERTIRHELVHLLTTHALEDRPLWVREGAASYFARERTILPERVSCPTDRELLHPISPGALTTASARATACFARQIAAGKKWTEIR